MKLLEVFFKKNYLRVKRKIEFGILVQIIF